MSGLVKPLSECRVLIVDDVKANIDVLVHALKSDYKLSIAMDGERALQSVQKLPPDLILLDIMMPGLDGYEVCRRLKSDPATREIPVMFLTALDELKNKTAAFELGATDYVTKPFEILEVKARVKSLLKAKAYSDAVREAIASELRIAREIQLGLIPTNPAKFLKNSRWEIAGLLESANEVGGDLYNVFPAGENSLCLAIGDVSGKGVPAALFMAVATTLLRSTARQGLSPAEILTRINDELAAENHSSMFVTLSCGLLDPASATLHLSSAGHPSPILLHAKEPPRTLFTDLGTLAGIMPDLPFESLKLQLEPNDAIVFYTDGVTEAMNPAEEQFGEQRLHAVLESSRDRPAQEIVSSLLSAVRHFAGAAPQSDDIAILIFRLLPQMELALPAQAERIMSGCSELEAFCRSNSVPEAIVHDILLAVEEAMSNVLKHGYHGDPTRKIHLEAIWNGQALKVEVRDQAQPYNPLDVPPPDLISSVEERPVGGLGVYLIRSLMDEVLYHYDRASHENRLTLIRQDRDRNVS